MIDDITAYSTTTRKTYPNWDALVEAEANGYVVVGQSSRPNTAAVVVGPYDTRRDAERAQPRLRNQWRREEQEYGYTIRTSIRILWKDKP